MFPSSRYKLTLSYRGTHFFGWQKQPKTDQPSVQGELERTFKLLYGQDIRVIGSGRTDRGVHALGQTAHVDLPTPLDKSKAQELLHKINRLTPPTLLIYRIELVPPKFHAQLWSRSKTYQYLLYENPFNHPLMEGLVARHPGPLTLERLNEAARIFLGEHDFKSFQTSGSEVPNTTRHISISQWTQAESLFTYTVKGSGFLKQMVRNLVGTQLEWAASQNSLGDLKSILEARDRRQAGVSAPPEGLYLVGVEYEEAVNAKCQNLAELPLMENFQLSLKAPRELAPIDKN